MLCFPGITKLIQPTQKAARLISGLPKEIYRNSIPIDFLDFRKACTFSLSGKINGSVLHISSRIQWSVPISRAEALYLKFSIPVFVAPHRVQEEVYPFSQSRSSNIIPPLGLWIGVTGQSGTCGYYVHAKRSFESVEYGWYVHGK